MPRLTALATITLFLGFAPAAGAQAPLPPPPPPPEPRIAPGIAVAGVDVSNLTLTEAAAKLEPALAPALAQTVRVEVAGRKFDLTPKAMRFTFDAAKSARRAYNAGKATPAAAGTTVSVAPWVRFRRAVVRDFANRIDRIVYIRPRNATIHITVRKIHRRKSKQGRDLHARALRAAIEAVVADPAAERLIRPGRKVLKAKVNANDLAKVHATVVTIDRSSFKLRLFKRLKLSKSYGIAVGASGYDTPAGRYTIQNKAVNPVWTAPNKPWAGLFAGRSVPGGSPENPLKARWLGIANGVGIHGTGDPGSIGSRASHGCIRMTVPAVIDLYERVPIGTPVLIG